MRASEMGETTNKEPYVCACLCSRRGTVFAASWSGRGSGFAVMR